MRRQIDDVHGDRALPLGAAGRDGHVHRVRDRRFVPHPILRGILVDGLLVEIPQRELGEELHWFCAGCFQPLRDAVPQCAPPELVPDRADGGFLVRELQVEREQVRLIGTQVEVGTGRTLVQRNVELVEETGRPGVLRLRIRIRLVLRPGRGRLFHPVVLRAITVQQWLGARQRVRDLVRRILQQAGRGGAAERTAAVEQQKERGILTHLRVRVHGEPGPDARPLRQPLLRGGVWPHQEDVQLRAAAAVRRIRIGFWPTEYRHESQPDRVRDLTRERFRLGRIAGVARLRPHLDRPICGEHGVPVNRTRTSAARRGPVRHLGRRERCGGCGINGRCFVRRRIGGVGAQLDPAARHPRRREIRAQLGLHLRRKRVQPRTGLEHHGGRLGQRAVIARKLRRQAAVAERGEHAVFVRGLLVDLPRRERARDQLVARGLLLLRRHPRPRDHERGRQRQRDQRCHRSLVHEAAQPRFA